MKEFGDLTIQLNCDLLRPANVSQAQKSFHARPGRVAVQMQPTPKRAGGILIPETTNLDHRLRPDIAQVIACAKDIPLEVGTHVVVNHAHGSHIEGFKAGEYKAAYETRIFGVARYTGGDVPAPIAWHNSILGICNTMKHKVYDVAPGSPVPIARRINSNKYESYIWLDASQGAECSVRIQKPNPGPDQISTLPTGKTLRLIVESHSFSDAMDVKCEIVCSERLDHVDLLDQKLPFRATGERLLVELPELHDVTTGGIQLTEKEAFRNTWVTVLSVGHLVPDVVPGQTILVRAEGLMDDQCFKISDLNPDKRALRLVKYKFCDLVLNEGEKVPA